MAITTAENLAVYIMDKYRKENDGKEISPLKLQKSLYFCFAYWGGFVRKGKMTKGELTEIDLEDFDEKLFDEEIEAWVYGPVVPVVYKKCKDGSIENYRNENIFKNKEYVKEYIDGILHDLFKASDFTLVEIAHEDKCWRNNFDFKKMSHNNVIKAEEIIDEYSHK